MKNQPFTRRLRFAVEGIRSAVRSESSFRTQLLLCGVLAVVLALVRPPAVWIALCVGAGASVLALELVNTALERLADHLHPEQHASIRVAKDCAAGAVLVASLAALCIGLLAIAAGIGVI